ncbi:MAG TPA: lactonase family protein [Trebonia sp.]
MQLFIGTYTERLPHVNGKAEGILTASFDPATGVIGPPRTAAAALNPSYLALSADGKDLYAVSETGSFGGRPGGGVAAYARDPAAAGGLTLLNAVPSGGPNPCYLSLDRTGRFVLVANYGDEAGSVTAYEVTPDGRLGNLTAHVRHAGSGPDPLRQAGAHAHMIVSDPVTGAVLAADLGSDAVLSYRLDDTGGLTPDGSARLAAAPGAGPRHLAFHPGGEHLLVINELDCTVSIWRRDGRRWAGAGCVSTLPAAAGDGPNLAAAIRVSPSGRHVLVSNRGHDSIAVYRFEPDRSALRLLGHAAAPGAVPRELVVTPDGRHVIVACQDSDLLASYPFDDTTGELGEPACVSAPTPVCLAFGPGGDLNRQT